jgi:acetyl esterase/lipase
MRSTTIPLSRVLFCAAILSFSASVLAQEKPKKKAEPKPIKVPDSVVYERDVQYGSAGDRALKLDVIRPKAERDRPRPVVVWIHGGGWRGGDKSSGLPLLLSLATGGEYVCFSVGYRLSGEAIWPAQIHDCKAAIRWIKANTKKYNIDPKRIGVWGSSAGGHLVSLLGTSSDIKELEGQNGSPDQDTRVACVVDFCGPSDFPNFFSRQPLGSKNAYGAITGLFGGTVEEKKAEATIASPITHVTRDDPPFLIVHGTNDETVPFAQGETFHKALKKAGCDATFVKMEGGGHGIGGREVIARVNAFFDKHLLGKDISVADEPIKVEAKKP